jgi:hypothetical protein
MGQYIERSLPMQIHWQVCEGLRKTLTPDNYKRLELFEAAKTREFTKFLSTCKGHEPNVSLLSKRIQLWLEHYKVKGTKELTPFVFGRDFMHGMPESKQGVIADLRTLLKERIVGNKHLDLQQTYFDSCVAYYLTNRDKGEAWSTKIMAQMI